PVGGQAHETYIAGLNRSWFGSVSVAAQALAHHSFAAEHDRSKPIIFTGKVTKVEWMNPHIYSYVDVKDEATGQVINYACEGGAPNGLYRNGWRKDSLKAGDSVTVDGWRAKDGSNTVNAEA